MTIDKIRVEALPDGGNWRLLEAISYRHGDVAVHVPAGFETDFASTPRLLWPIFPPFGRWTAAAVIYDYLYRTGLQPKVIADAIFMAAMQDLGVPEWKRWAMYLAVRLFGGSSYRPSHV